MKIRAYFHFDKVLLILLTASLLGCSHPANRFDHSIPMELYRYVGSDNAVEKYTACVLLGELPLSAKMINQIREDISQTTDICHRYLLAESSQEFADIAEYIEVFPSGERQNLLWALHFDAGFPVSFVSPYFNLLAAQARHNDEALDKLISGMPYADASSGEVLIDLLADIYRYFPEKIHTRLKANQIPENFI